MADGARPAWPDRALRAGLAVLVVWDVGCGTAALVWPEWMGRVRGAEGGPMLHYIRVIGVFWLYVAFMQALGAWDLGRFLLAAQLAILLRLPTGLYHVSLVVVCCATDEMAVVPTELFFGLGDLAIFAGGWWLLRRGGRRLLGG